MTKIIVKDGGPLTTVQDEGRYGYQKFGMPTAGAMDKYSYKIANFLVENNGNEAVLESTLKGPKLKFESNAIIAVTGAKSKVKIDGKKIKMWKSHYIKKGSILEISMSKKGLRNYIAFKGGLDLPKVMDSKSTYLRGKLGGYKGRKLKNGDKLKLNKEVEKNNFEEKKLAKKDKPNFSQKEVRVIMGPQDNYFTNKGISNFLKEDFKVSSQADRMGYRLKGKDIEHKDGADIISDGIAPGSIQVSGDGKAIIMLADRQTTGGYTKIATVISVDLDIVSQKKPGDLITFKKVSLSEAHNLLKKREEIYKKIRTKNVELSSTKSYKIRVEGEEYEVELREIL